MRMQHITTAALLSLMLTAPVAAQEQPAGLPFAGCWAPADGFSALNRICLTPTGASMLEFTTIAADGKVTESILSLDGRRVAVKTEECEGWEEGRLTADGERIIVNAEITCGREPKQVRMTAFTITPSGYLLQATGTGFAMVANTQVRVFGPVESYADIPPATRELLMPYLASAERARLAVRDNAVSAKDLVEFDRLGVAPSLIDLMVAASYPKSFVIDGVGAVAGAGQIQGNAVERQMSNQFLFMNGYPMLSMYDWQMLYECRRTGFSCPTGVYGYSAYGYGGYSGRYGLGGGWGGNGGYIPGYGIPVVVRPVTTQPSGTGSSGGRAVRGRGYTQTGSGSDGSTATPRSSAGSSNGGSSVQSSGGSSSAGSSAGSSSSGSSERTAKPRSP